MSPLLKNEWVRLKFGPLLFIDRMVSNDAASYALVKAEAAAGGGRKASLYKGIARSDNCPPRSVGRPLPLPQPLAVGPNRPPRRAKFTHSKFKRASYMRLPTCRNRSLSSSLPAGARRSYGYRGGHLARTSRAP